jgi:phosphoribosyl 1,2-cyclic phosphodiesterase
MGEMMKVKFWGTRGSISSPGTDTIRYGGNTTCLELTLESGRTLIIDAGSGIRKLGIELLRKEPPLNIYLLMTHIHWDHLVGFPFFSPVYRKGTKIIVDGCAKGIKGLRNIFNSQYVDGTFPVGFNDLMASIEPGDALQRGNLYLDGVRIDSTELQHPQGGMGFRFTENGKVLVFLTDNELRSDAPPGRTFTDFAEFCKDADILIHDTQYIPEEINLRKGWGHSEWSSVIKLAVESKVKRLYLFHHDPERTDIQIDEIVASSQILAKEMGSPLLVEGAMEGSSFIL